MSLIPIETSKTVREKASHSLVLRSASVMSCRVIKASCGGCTHFVTVQEVADCAMTVGFGQGVVSGSGWAC